MAEISRRSLLQGIGGLIGGSIAKRGAEAIGIEEQTRPDATPQQGIVRQTAVTPEPRGMAGIVADAKNNQVEATPTATETEVPEFPKQLFSVNPASPEAQNIAEGFNSECNFTMCNSWQMVANGPFARERDHASQGFLDDATYEVEITGKGSAAVGATDGGQFRDTDQVTNAFYGQEINLSEGPAKFKFHWPGLQPTGYGMEITVQQRDGEKVVVSNITLTLIGRGNLT